MAKKQFSFFATKNDLLDALDLAVEKATFSYSCLNEGAEYPDVFQSAAALDDLSIAKFGNQNNEKLYLLIESKAQPATRKVEQRRGGVGVFFDQLSHPASVALRPGGLIDSSNCIVAGQIGTTSSDEWSDNLYKVIFSSFKKRFAKIHSFYVGAEAEEKLDLGYRLTANIKSPEEYDLKR